MLIKCLREHVVLFAWSVADMFVTSSNISYHLLIVDPRKNWVAQHRQYQSDEKANATAKAVEDLVKEDFVKEVIYTTCLSIVVLVKKANGKWRMCVDYTDLNRACPNDAYLYQTWTGPPDSRPLWTPIQATTKF